MNLCSINGCNNIHKARGFCLKHYKRFMKGQDLHSENLRFKSCSIPGCLNKHSGKGLCSKHYQRKFRKKNIHIEIKKNKNIINCKVPYCKKKVYEGEYCHTHFLTGGYSPNLSTMKKGYLSNKSVLEIKKELTIKKMDICFG